MKRSVLWLTGGILCLCLVLSLVIIRSREGPLTEVNEQNWRSLWQSASGTERHPIADYLVGRRVLLHREEAELIELLGEPDRTNALPSRWSLLWDLGHRRSGSQMMYPYHEYLVVSLTTGSLSYACQIVNLD